MPTGKVEFFDAKRGFGFVGDDDGVEVSLHTPALPKGAAVPRPGTRVEYGVADECKDPQALTVKILSPTRFISVAHRRKPQAMVPVVEDLTELLDASSTALRSGGYPENPRAIVKVLRTMADDFDA